MKYTDEESRMVFHQSCTLLQMVCERLERICLDYRKEPEFIDVVDDFGYKAILHIPDVTGDEAEDIVDKVNREFPRVDGEDTCTVYDPELGIVEIFVTSPKEFVNLN